MIFICLSFSSSRCILYSTMTMGRDERMKIGGCLCNNVHVIPFFRPWENESRVECECTVGVGNDADPQRKLKPPSLFEVINCSFIRFSFLVIKGSCGGPVCHPLSLSAFIHTLKALLHRGESRWRLNELKVAKIEMMEEITRRKKDLFISPFWSERFSSDDGFLGESRERGFVQFYTDRM